MVAEVVFVTKSGDDGDGDDGNGREWWLLVVVVGVGDK